MIRSLFPIYRPRLGLSFRAHGLDLIEVRRRWRQPPIVVRVASRAIPAGVLTPSATTPNMPDPAAVAQEVEALLEGVRDRTVAVDLPMACGTPALLHFETFPTARTEQEALLRWRLRQEEHLTAPDLTLHWHAVSEGKSSSTARSVLVVAIRQSILDQYHRVCEEADLVPVSIGWSTIHLLSLARSAFSRMQEEIVVAHRSAEALIVLALRQGRPVGLRVKPMRRACMDLKTELIQTVQYLVMEEAPTQQALARTTPVYLVEEGDPTSASLGPHDQTEIWTLSHDPSWTVPVHRARWATAPIMSTVAAPVHPPFAALAGILAA